jgi:S1-C subfamily serine protease
MDRNDKEEKNVDIIDEDLYEEFDDEELYELVQEEKKKALERARQKREEKPKSIFPKWAFWLIAFALAFNVFALIPQTFSIPAIDFLVNSAQLSTQEDIREYKEAVVVIETVDSKGTGFAIDGNGTILTNHHVIEDEEQVTVAFPEHGLHQGEVVAAFPEIDLAIVEVEGENLPYLTLAEETSFTENEEINFIGNPLRFNGIANEGTIIGYTQLSSWELPVIMIQAPVYRGNSGSPIITKDGEVIGVIFATLDHDDHGKVGLFVPIDYFYASSNQ